LNYFKKKRLIILRVFFIATSFLIKGEPSGFFMFNESFEELLFDYISIISTSFLSSSISLFKARMLSSTASIDDSSYPDSLLDIWWQWSMWAEENALVYGSLEEQSENVHYYYCSVWQCNDHLLYSYVIVEHHAISPLEVRIGKTRWDLKCFAC
jgi:hypothetical protein